MKTASDAAVVALGNFASATAMSGAAFTLRRLGYELKDAEVSRACAIIARHAKAALTEALADGKAALAVNMPEIALATVKASFWLAGVKAGEEIAAS